MPKVKTKKIVSKRFKLTKNGKVIHRTQGARHIRRRKSKAQQRRQDKPKTLTTTKIINVIKGYLNT